MKTIEMTITFYREDGDVRLGEVKNLIAEAVKAAENFNKEIKIRVDMRDHYDE